MSLDNRRCPVCSRPLVRRQNEREHKWRNRVYCSAVCRLEVQRAREHRKIMASAWGRRTGALSAKRRMA